MPRIMIDLICPLRFKHNWTTLIVLTALGSLVYCDPRNMIRRSGQVKWIKRIRIISTRPMIVLWPIIHKNFLPRQFRTNRSFQIDERKLKSGYELARRYSKVGAFFHRGPLDRSRLPAPRKIQTSAFARLAADPSDRRRPKGRAGVCW